MRPNDFDEFSKIVLAFAELKGQKLSPPAVKLYWGAMQGWDIEDFRAAAEQLLRTCEWMPTPKHFEDLRKAGRPVAGEAWIRAREHSRTAIVGGHATRGTSCGDALIDRAVQALGGYGVIAMCETDKLGFLERRFAEHYESLQGVDDVRAAVPQIVGEYAPQRLSGPRRLLS